MKRLLGIALRSLGLLTQARGQSGPAARPAPPPAAAPRTWGLMVDWLPLLARGYHFSAERALGGPGSRQTVVLTPQLYRFYLGPSPTPLAGTYLAYGLNYQHFRLDFQSPSWQSELAEDGLAYYQNRLRDQTETIDRYGATLVIGRQMKAPDSPFFLDVFLGLGLRRATSRSTMPGPQFEATSSDYGHAGAYLPMGFRLGLHL